MGFDIGLLGTGVNAVAKSDVVNFTLSEGTVEWGHSQSAELGISILGMPFYLYKGGDYQSYDALDQPYERIVDDGDNRISFNIGAYLGIGFNLSISLNGTTFKELP